MGPRQKLETLQILWWQLLIFHFSRGSALPSHLTQDISMLGPNFLDSCGCPHSEWTLTLRRGTSSPTHLLDPLVRVSMPCYRWIGGQGKSIPGTAKCMKFGVSLFWMDSNGFQRFLNQLQWYNCHSIYHHHTTLLDRLDKRMKNSKRM